MSKHTWFVYLIVGAMFLVVYPIWAQYFGGMEFESRIQGLTNDLVSILLPAISILGLIYAAMLAASGDEGAKKRMLLIIFGSIVGFLAPIIIRWFQTAAGG